MYANRNLVRFEAHFTSLNPLKTSPKYTWVEAKSNRLQPVNDFRIISKVKISI